MKKKTDIVRELVSAGENKKALQIAKGFKIGITKDESVAMQRAYECMVNPSFYREIGKNVEEEIEKGIAVLKALYA